MKKILFFFALLLSTLSASEIDEYITDVYFGNGILTKEKELKNKVKQDKQETKYKTSITDGYRVLVVAHSQGILYA